MTWLKRGAALGFALLLISLMQHVSIVDARLVGTPPTNPDVVCFGGGASAAVATNEVCVDYSGDFLPTTTGVATLGTSSLKWLQAWITTLTATTITTANFTATYTAATSTGTVINSAASPTADILEVQSNGSTVAVVTSQLLFKPYATTLALIKTTTPTGNDLGGVVICKDCAATYSICVATGATIQGFRLTGSGTAECK